MSLKNTIRILKAYSAYTPKATMEKTASTLRNDLARATPVDSGETAASWNTKVIKTAGGYEMSVYNSSKDTHGDSVLPLIEYGHGTRNGGYVPARPFVKRIAIKDTTIFSEEITMEVRRRGR